MRVTFKLEAGELKRKLAAINKGFLGFYEPLKETSEYQRDQINKNFTSEGANLGERWTPLQTSTILQRIALGFGSGPILQRTGSLKNSFYESVIDNKSLEIASSNPHFAAHQSGKGKLPARPMIGHTDTMKKKVVSIFNNYLLNVIKNG